MSECFVLSSLLVPTIWNTVAMLELSWPMTHVCQRNKLSLELGLLLAHIVPLLWVDPTHRIQLGSRCLFVLGKRCCSPCLDMEHVLGSAGGVPAPSPVSTCDSHLWWPCRGPHPAEGTALHSQARFPAASLSNKLFDFSPVIHRRMQSWLKTILL